MLILCMHNIGFAQVGIGTTSPDQSSMLDIQATNKGILIPRLTTVQRNTIIDPATGLLIFNTTSNAFEYNSGIPASPIWSQINTASSTYMGKFIISGTGSQTITGLPFRPTAIKFSAYANVESYNINADNGVGNNNNTFQNTFGGMNGYATNYSGSIQQQVIFNGGNGNSINDISRYASDTRAIGIRYANQNGDNLGLTAAAITSFNVDGFTINVTNHTENIVVIYEAFK
ncbi:hypothetical protein L3X39_10655 [Sabulilitoribacter multivorans]|uniref:Uncharacterized protein n=1 Tax=Flaviramulus multivorans TaxID=1304750 RepID=A0ABS9IKF7_9FLAO|nr:hypothetical protein [Flaviramulus multivorans]MCF7561096.1 hypothetical protein [Flaviramulus multivorans]